MPNKKLSLIILLNRNVKKCLEDIRIQSYKKDMEIIGLYKEEKKNEILEIKNIYPEIKFILYKKNFFKALNDLNIIQGEYVSILNSEDEVTIDFYRTMINEADKNDADVIISNAILKYSDGGKAYLNLSESSLIESEDENNLENYIKQSEVSFLWNIYGNKVFSKALYDFTVKKIAHIEDEVQNLYFFSLIFYNSKKVKKIDNEVLFYNFEQENGEGIRNFLNNYRIIDDKLYKNMRKNFEYIEAFFTEKNIKININNLKNYYLNNKINAPKDFFTKIKTAWNNKLEELKKEVIKSEVVSFEIFDTLIVKPFWNKIDIFEFLNNYFREITGTKTGISFSKIRITAEEEARKKIQYKQEISLNDIYLEIEKLMKIDNGILEKMKQQEEKLEYRFSSIRKTGKEIYELAKYLNKKIICIEDNYLPIDRIRRILENNKYNIDIIYLSSEKKLTKSNGELYRYVIEDLNISADKIVHIGSSYKNDYENAKKHKINAQFLPNAIDVFCNKNITNVLSSLFLENMSIWEENTNGLNFLGIRCMLALVANSYFDNPYRTFNNESIFNADPNFIGYYALGMHLFGITDWLIKNTIKQKYDNIVFCARDGYCVMKVYQMLKKIYTNAPDEKYLYISRRALIPATLNNKFDFYKLSELIDIYKYTPITILKYFNNVLVNLENIEVECKKIGIDTEKKFESISEFFVYINLIIEKFYNKNKHNETINYLRRYFNNVFDKKTCIFDIGYSAKTEMYLSILCKKKIDTFFINISNQEALEHSKLGDFNLGTYFEYRPSITGVVRESLMSISDPSCIGYDIDNNGDVTPIFEKIENNYQKRFVFDVMQTNAIKFIRELLDIFSDYMDILYYQRYYISLPHEMFINSPLKIDQDIFYGIDFEDTIGLGKEVSAIQEWNRELADKKQKRINELFDYEYIKNLKDKYSILEKEFEIQKKEMMLQYERTKDEISQIYNSKRWKIFDIINTIKRKNNK